MSNLPVSTPIDYSSRDFNSVLTDLIGQIPNYLPEWVDRSSSDFGIALLELFAYQADLLNYYIDRIANEAFLPSAQQRQSILNIASLLDYTPTGNIAATASLQFTIANPSPSPITVPAGTKVTTVSAQGVPVIFETTKVLKIWGDNAAPTVANILGTGQPGQQVTLTGNYDGGTGIAVTVSAVAWTRSPDDSFSGHGYTAASLVYIVVNGNIVKFGDNVAGKEPPLAAPIVITYSPAGGVAQYYASVPATQGVNITSEAVGSSTGAPAQTFTLFGSPVVDNSVQINVDEGNGPQPWTSFVKMIDASLVDLAYTVNVLANGVVQVVFGDGVNGRIPIPNAVITASYQTGGGAIGNVAQNSLTILPQTVQGVLSVTNPQAASGGSDAESLDHIRTSAPASLTAINRAVTATDYATLVEILPTVAKTSAVALSLTVIAIYVHPQGGFFSPSSGLDAAVAALALQITNPNGTTPGYLDDKKMAFTSVQVLPPKYHNGGTVTTGYVPVNVSITLVVLPQYNQNSVLNSVITAINGLFAFSSVDFGIRIPLSTLYQTFQAVSGVAYGAVTLFARNEASGVGDIICAVDEIPIAATVNVTASGGLV